ncbi:hypothetical protein PAECIP111894_00133 [Paenibacillus pseudetheri]|uniref:Transposase n=1 Tax=Paenibacillus pseudetheri TaxID=2897682 RepID=A0ABM9B672_9BACL|nr:hypothetical protein PAECIP111894_00133 [Paenibacillus pseudetheri]
MCEIVCFHQKSMNDLARLILICIKDIQFLRKEQFVNANVWLEFFLNNLMKYIINSIRGMELERLSKKHINPNGIIKYVFLYFYFYEKSSLFNT